MKKTFIFGVIYLFSNFINAQCLGSQIFTLNPAGPYITGQTVTATYTLNNFIQTNSNWIIAFDIDYGPGWSSISPVSAPANPNTNDTRGTGNWFWDTQNTYPSGLNFGPGYRFNNTGWDSQSWNIGDEDWGSSSLGPFTLSFQLTVGNSCTPQDLSVDLSVLGDCQTGGWSNGACCSIIPFNIYNGTSTDNSTSNTSTDIACDTYTWPVNGIAYINSGTYTDVTSDPTTGCDHTETLVLTINNSTANTTTDVACDSYTWPVNGIAYTNSGTYTDVTSDPTTGCDHTETLNLIVGYSNQIDLIIAENHISCFGYNDGSITLTPNGGTPPFQYSWSNGAVSQSISALSAGDYSFSFTDANGCKLDSLANIDEANQILLDFIATSPICRHDESTLLINISNSTSNIYTVSLQDSILKSFVIDTNGLLIPAGVPIKLYPNYSGEVYIVSLTDEEGCTGIYNDSVHIEVKQPPQLSINEVDLCEGSPSFTLNNATPNGGFYSINNELTNYLDVENLGVGVYNVGYTYTDPISTCSNQINETITISESPKAEMLFSPQPTDIDNPTIFFRDNSNEMVLYSEWDLGDGTIINDETNFWHTYADTGTYTIKYYITNMYECTDSVIKYLTINPIYLTFIPDAFTPNNDGDNDYFYPSIIGGNSYNMRIYNRWGEIIYNEDDGIWDGKINNTTVEIGYYSYSILVNDFKNKPFIYTGIITLIK